MAEFKNPNQSGGPSNNSSLLVMMVVMLGVALGLQYFRAKNPPPTPPRAPAATASPNGSGATGTGAASTSSAAAANPAAPTMPVERAQAESTTVVENSFYRITFSNRGGQVTSWILKNFKDADGKPLDLVHTQAAQRFGYPLSLYTYDPGLTENLAKGLYIPSATGTLPAPATLTFRYSDGSVEAVKTFTFDQSYVIHASVRLTRNGAPIGSLLAWPGGLGSQFNQQTYASAQVDLSRSGGDEHLAAKKVSGGETLSGPFDWAGTSDNFFAAVFLPDRPQSAAVVTFHNELDVSATIHRTGWGSGSPPKGPINESILGLALGDASGQTDTRVFVGPKSINVLRSVSVASTGGGRPRTLEPLLEFGFWGAIGKYLFLALQFIHTRVTAAWPGSWGWAIILLTIVINLIMLPFRIQTMRNSLKMQRIQPQMDAIKARYKGLKATDPKRGEMNAEIMKLQKDHGVNMFGGCIPTLITLPFLWAFFTMLPRVVELRGAHWLWLPDLQAPDPWHILPILMVVSQIVMQLYTPSPGIDKQQQRMMAFTMPAFTGFIVWSYGSGLGLYWAVGNLIGIAQQLVMNRTSMGREMREIAERRARRKAGRGSSVIQGKR